VALHRKAKLLNLQLDLALLRLMLSQLLTESERSVNSRDASRPKYACASASPSIARKAGM
jgi:hypothetical protein